MRSALCKPLDDISAKGATRFTSMRDSRDAELLEAELEDLDYYRPAPFAFDLFACPRLLKAFLANPPEAFWTPIT